MSKHICPECGKPLPAGSPDGTCPTCLLSLGLTAALAPESLGPLPSSAAPGDHIGRYKLLELIGEGGFGNVWMAEQQEPVRRKVALKILKLGMDTREVVARFEAERQALAMMDHANIAKVLDAGATEQGRPFFVMELVAGVPMTTFCDEHGLDTRQRIELFVLVCEAVQHAHQKGVIHRDLKPGNILVSEQDGRFVPKVIDFGVAKALEEPLTDKTFFTRYHQFLGTPAYMSPEQAGLGGLDVDTRSDIYSLGVLLYELLTGRTPFTNEQLRRAQLEEVLRVIREQEPPKPSTRLTEDLAADDLRRRSSSQSGESASSRQRLQRLIGLLRGELDWIILKALDKDRARRYATANGFATDLRRYLSGETVTAAPPTVAYRFQKTWRRHKLIFTAAAAVTASLLIGLGVSTWMFIKQTEAYREARAAEAEQTRLRALEERSATVLRESLYASEMAAAFHAWAEGRVDQARDLQDKQRPNHAANQADLRSFDWRYLWTLTRHTELFTLTNAATWGFALSPDGQTVAGCVDGRLGLWSLLDRREVATLATNVSFVFSAAFSPDGTTLAVPNNRNSLGAGESIGPDAHDATNGFVQFWDVATRRLTHEIRLNRPVLGMAYSPNGRILATAGGNMYQRNAAGEVKLWDPVTGKELMALQGLPAWVYQVAFSPDGRVLATSCGDGVVRLWDAESGSIITQLSGHNGFVAPATFTHDGKLLAAGDEAGYVWFWDWIEGRLEAVFKAHDAPIYSIAFSADDQRLVTASRDSTAKLWDRRTRRELTRFAGHGGGVTTARFLQDGQSLVTASQDSSIKVWNPNPRAAENLLARITDAAGVTFTSGGKFLAVGEYASVRVIFFDPIAGTQVKTLRGHELAASRDGKVLIVLRDSEVIFLDPISLAEIARIDCKTQLGGRPSFSPDGKWLAFRRGDSSDHLARTRVVIIDVAQRRVAKEIETDNEAWAPVFFARGGAFLLTMQWETQRTVVWDTTTWGVLRTFHGSPAEQSVAAVSTDGLTFAMSGKEGWIRLWDLGRLVEDAPINFNAGGIHSIAFDPDGKTLAVGTSSGVIKLWDLRARQEIASLSGHGSHAQHLTFSPDGRGLASSGFDKTIRLWRAPSFEEIAAAEKNWIGTPRR